MRRMVRVLLKLLASKFLLSYSSLFRDVRALLFLCDKLTAMSLAEQSVSIHKKKERSYGAIMLNRLTGSKDGRVDHVLQDKTFRHPYVSAIGAHTNYWRDYDTALFMLRHLYRDVAEEPNLSSSELKGSSRSSLKGWCKQREILDEELPLTFADNVFMKHFSYQVKKMSKKH